jgi:phosphoribosylformimino-5-aminoimidazole carboxamide ribotide isomerase
MKFRPCIDLHGGVVKQIVGGTLNESEAPTENFVSDLSAAHYASLYKRDGLVGGALPSGGDSRHKGRLQSTLRAGPRRKEVSPAVAFAHAPPQVT